MGKKDQRIKTELERRILLGLALEWENARNGLPDAYRHRLKRPTFRLSAMHSTLGYWSSNHCQIVLSRQFVFDHSWDSVREVLHHEMAHQLAESLAGGKTSRPHGEAFKKACDILGASPKASGKYPPLDDRLRQTRLGREDRRLLKVRKLMALAHSCNRHEAEAAMSKAQQLVSKYNLDIIAKDKQRSFLSAFIGAPALRHHREAYHLASLLNDFYYVYGIWVPAYVVDKEKMGRALEISGLAKNVQLARYTYTILNRYIDDQWTLFNQSKGFNRYRKTDYAIGIIEGFRRKLQKTQPDAATQSTGGDLVKVADHRLKAYVRSRYPRIRSRLKRAGTFNENIWCNGLAAGSKLVIAKGIHDKRSSVKPPLLADNE